MAVSEAEDAIKNFKTDHDRRSHLTFDYVPPSVLEELEREQASTVPPKPKPTKTKRKSLLPPPQKLTPLDELDYRESPSAVFDPDLAIPHERFTDANSNSHIFPELITGEGKKLYFWQGIPERGEKRSRLGIFINN